MRILLLALLGMAGCTQAPADPSGNEANVSQSAPEAATPAPAPDNANAPLPPAPSPTATSTLPAALRGGWTADKTGDCATDNELRIDIAADRIDFYESRARLKSVTQTDPHSWTAAAELTGEGQTWQRQIRLMLGEDGRLTRAEPGMAEISYTRCPESTR